MGEISRGLSYAEVALAMGVTISTVRTHVARAMKGLGLSGRRSAAAVVVMKDMGWLGAVPRRAPEEDPPLPPAHLAYCLAFTRLILNPTPANEHQVTIAYMLLCMQSGFRPKHKRNTPDVGELLLRMARGCSREIPE